MTKINIEINIPIEVLETIKEMERQEESLARKERKYRSNLEFKEDFTKCYNQETKDVADLVISKMLYEELYKALNQLTETERRRIYLYYFYDLTLQEIANMENVLLCSIHKSIRTAQKKLKNNLSKLND